MSARRRGRPAIDDEQALARIAELERAGVDRCAAVRTVARECAPVWGQKPTRVRLARKRRRELNSARGDFCSAAPALPKLAQDERLEHDVRYGTDEAHTTERIQPPSPLKENLLWVRRFDTVEELRQALLEFQRLYNQSWIVERHGYRTPAQVRADQLGALATAA